MSKFLMHLFAAFAEMERGIIREWVCAGVRAARVRGTALGRPRRVFRRDEAGNNWRNVVQTLGMPMSTVIDACRECSENLPKARRRNRANTTPYLPSVYRSTNRVFRTADRRESRLNSACCSFAETNRPAKLQSIVTSANYDE